MCVRPASERRHYDVMSSLVGWSHTQKNPWENKRQVDQGVGITATERVADTLLWRHNRQDGVSNHQHHDCLFNRSFRRTSKKTSKLRVTDLCEGNSPMTGEFPTQRASNEENLSIWWRHYDWQKKPHITITAAVPTWTLLYVRLKNIIRYRSKPFLTHCDMWTRTLWY